MTTKLQGPLKREIEIDGIAYTVTITPQDMTFVSKGRRKGFHLEWRSLVSGEAALANALNASLFANFASHSTEKARADDPGSRSPKRKPE